MLVYKAMAFVRRDFIIHSNYKVAFVFELLMTVFPVLSFYFVSKLIGQDGSSSLSRYGGQYFPFVMIGIGVTHYFMLALQAFTVTIRNGQMTGCLEAMLSTQTRPETVIVLSSLYSFGTKLVHLIIIFAIGGLWLGVDYTRCNVPSAIAILILSVLTFSSLGIFSAALTLIFKKGDPIQWIFGSLSSLLGGAMFPVSIMPDSMQRLAAFLPITYSLEAMRLAVLRGHSMLMLWKPMAILGGMSIVLLPLSVWSFSKAVEKGRRDGSLMQY